MPANSPAKRPGFTLIELLVVMVIIAILIALLLPAVQMIRAAAYQMQCMNNLKQVGLALQNYHTSHRRFPPAGFYHGSELSWHVAVLPYLEQQNLHEQFDLSKGYTHSANLKAALTRVDVFLCPSQAEDRSVLCRLFGRCGNRNRAGADPYTTHYYGVLGPEGAKVDSNQDYPKKKMGTCGDYGTTGVLLHDRSVRMADIRDGASNTFLVGEISWTGAGMYRTYGRGTNDDGCQASASAKNLEHAIGVFAYKQFIRDFNDVSFGSEHPSGGAHFVYCDGSVHFISEQVDFGTYKSMGSRNEGEVAQVSN